MERTQEKTDTVVSGRAPLSGAHRALNAEHADTERGVSGVRRGGAWRWPGLRRLLDRPLTSFYLILGITTLLLASGVLMVISISSVQQLHGGKSPHSSLQHQLIGLAIGIPCMWLAARSSPTMFRALAYPLLALSVVGLCLPLIHGVGVSQNGAARWISVGGQQVQPSEFAKLALALWGADLLARKHKLGQLTDWRHMLVPLMPGTGVLCIIVLTGDDLGTTFILLAIFLALLWVIGAPGRVFSGLLILMVLAMLLMMVSATDLYPLGGSSGPDMQAILGNRAVGSGGWFGVGLAASSQKWGFLPNASATTNFIFAILGEDLGLAGALCVTMLYAGLAYTGLRIAQRVDDIFIRLAVTGATAWIVAQAFVNIGGVLGLFPVISMSLPLVSYGVSSLPITMTALGMLMSFAKRERDAVRAIAAGAGHARRVLSLLWLGSWHQ